MGDTRRKGHMVSSILLLNQMNIINLGILAHIAAGKTSVTENLLFACGATEKRGSVDKGDTIKMCIRDSVHLAAQKRGDGRTYHR